jgi:hypothetical protein
MAKRNGAVYIVGISIAAVIFSSGIVVSEPVIAQDAAGTIS